MADETHNLLCGNCHIPIEARVDDDGNGTVRCPACGENDTLDAATSEAIENHTVDMLDSAFSGITPGGPITVKKSPKRHYRFVFSD